ncbi:rRNA pseudouridine synthase [bacterium]|nr:rRNA pseudouridine synthase [bacterium]
MKLHVYLRNLGVASRRKSEELIAADRVLVNGKLAHIGQIVEGNELIEVNGQKYRPNNEDRRYSYVLLCKPVGYTSTTVDFYSNEHSVLELLPHELRKKTRWQIVGRLDKNSEGLLLLTDNGDVGYVLTHPRYQVEKQYEVTVKREITEGERQELLRGVTSEVGEAYQFKALEQVNKNTYRITLVEGKKREIREAFRVVRNHVWRLKRLRIGNLQLGELQPSNYRELSENEVITLLSFVQRVRDSYGK